MRAWPNAAIACLLLGAVSAQAERSDFAPASQDAILAGAKACIGATTDPAGTTARLSEWSNAPKGSFKTNGRALMRDHVLLAITPGMRGGCVITAQAAPGFSGKRLLADLQQSSGARLRSDAPPVLALPNGELMRVNIGSQNGGPTYVQLALVNAKGK